MQFVLFFLLSIFSCLNGYSKTLDTRCIGNDCFANGWQTTEPGTNYQLVCKCKNNDCTKSGWSSRDNRNSRFDVNCKQDGCFVGGWTSVQHKNGSMFVDIITCKSRDCLKNGWDIASAYPGGDGQVTCRNGDCEHFGGSSFWRGERSQTHCHLMDCYKYGWLAKIEK